MSQQTDQKRPDVEKKADGRATAAVILDSANHVAPEPMPRGLDA